MAIGSHLYLKLCVEVLDAFGASEIIHKVPVIKVLEECAQIALTHTIPRYLPRSLVLQSRPPILPSGLGMSTQTPRHFAIPASHSLIEAQ